MDDTKIVHNKNIPHRPVMYFYKLYNTLFFKFNDQ